MTLVYSKVGEKAILALMVRWVLFCLSGQITSRDFLTGLIIFTFMRLNRSQIIESCVGNTTSDLHTEGSVCVRACGEVCYVSNTRGAVVSCVYTSKSWYVFLC